MADQKEPKLSPVEGLKTDSNYLRGTISAELENELPNFESGSVQILKHHGMYQQDDRDLRMANREKGVKDKAFMMMLRTRIPGGKLTSRQMLAEIDLCDELGNNTLRLTTRQAIQLHGIYKSNLREVIRRTNEVQMSTLGACGDVNRNVMCCPAPFKNRVYDEIQDMADRISEHFLPRTTAYHEIWLTDPETGEKERVEGGPEGHVIEPIYGTTYLPRKFKTAIALDYDNCVDVYTNDLGLIAIVESGEIIGYNVVVGGGMGVTPAKKTTFPALAHRLTFVEPDQVIGIGEAIMKVQRDFGNREDRKHARMKYLIDNWGIEKFRNQVADYYGAKLEAPHEKDVSGFNDHMGWDEQGDGKWFYGLNVENGRVWDNDRFQLKSAIREICSTLEPEIRLTSHQSLIFADVEESCKEELTGILKKHGVQLSEEYSTVRRWSMACVAWPTCGLAITESERALPVLMDQLEPEMARLGLSSEELTIRMTGCPNGCARPYNPDIGLVGKAKNRYTMYLGGRLLGNRLGFIYKDLVPFEEVVPEIVSVLSLFKANREEGETFGDFCDRIGKEDLLEMTAA
ncbi:MAG: NADPH-dependent assimilatory sulfite reductase hemoprotein subunit [Planctomycetota bacterium]|nr:NADPH-dependent assimilatory sulfite reductase hemoprotein subunit [Planctomycetota bacterium]